MTQSRSGEAVAKLVDLRVRLRGGFFRSSRLSPFLVEASDGGEAELLLDWETSPAPKATPYEGVRGHRLPECVRSEEGLWFRRLGGVCLVSPDLSAWHAWAPGPLPAEEADFDGSPWLMLAVWGALAKRGGAFLHGATCVLGGKHVLLLGDSGVGKSTLSQLVVSAGGSCLTDENPFVTTAEGIILAHGSPWPGLRGADVPIRGQVHAVFFLRHAGANTIRRMSEGEAGRRLLGNVRFFEWEPAFTPGTIELLDRMATSLPVFDLGFAPTPAAVGFLEDALGRLAP